MKNIKVKPGEFIREEMTKEELEEVKKILEYYKNKESDRLEIKKTYSNSTKEFEF